MDERTQKLKNNLMEKYSTATNGELTNDRNTSLYEELDTLVNRKIRYDEDFDLSYIPKDLHVHFIALEVSLDTELFKFKKKVDNHIKLLKVRLKHKNDDLKTQFIREFCVKHKVKKKYVKGLLKALKDVEKY